MRRRYNPLAADMRQLAATLKKRSQEQQAAAPVTPVAPPKPPKKPTKAAYRKALAEHDWNYDYSDDYSVWKKGSEHKKALLAMQVVLDPDRVIWNQYEKRGRK